MKVIIMCGVPGSGKTTRAKEIAKKYDMIHLSSDEYRKRLLGDENCQKNNALIFNVLYEDAKFFVEKGHSIILDMCNVTNKDIKKIMDLFSDLDNKPDFILWKMGTPIAECIERDAKRERTVGPEVIHKFVCKMNNNDVDSFFTNIIRDHGEKLEELYEVK